MLHIEREADAIIQSQKTSLKGSVFTELKNSSYRRKHFKRLLVQSSAFNIIRLHRIGLKAFYNHKMRSIELRSTYGKLSKIYRDQLISKAFMILQWNQMRSIYQNSLYSKAFTFYTKKRTAKVFKSLKQYLIYKYKSQNVSSK